MCIHASMYIHIKLVLFRTYAYLVPHIPQVSIHRHEKVSAVRGWCHKSPHIFLFVFSVGNLNLIKIEQYRICRVSGIGDDYQIRFSTAYNYGIQVISLYIEWVVCLNNHSKFLRSIRNRTRVTLGRYPFSLSPVLGQCIKSDNFSNMLESVAGFKNTWPQFSRALEYFGYNIIIFEAEP